MPLNLASPGILVKEFDLTLGRVTPSSNKIGAIVAPFAKGPVDVPTLVENENDLLVNFGQPYSTDNHYEHWLVASSYLAYGGSLKVVRANDDELQNGFVGVATSVRINSLQHYEELGYDENTLPQVVFAAKNPGTWSNGVRVAFIDSRADQVLDGIDTQAASIFTPAEISIVSNRQGVLVGSASTVAITTTGILAGQIVRCDTPNVLPENTTVVSVGSGIITLSKASQDTGNINSTFDFSIISDPKGGLIVGGASTVAISTDNISLGQRVRCNTLGVLPGIATVVSIGSGVIGLSTASVRRNDIFSTFDFGTISVGFTAINLGDGIRQSLSGKINPGVGNKTTLRGDLKGIVTRVIGDTISVKVLSYIAPNGVEEQVDYQQSGIYQFDPSGGEFNFYKNGQTTSNTSLSYSSSYDWFDAQDIKITETTSINWNNIAPRPGTSGYAAARNSRFDEIHVVIIDANGSISGNAGTILEKHLGLSKAKDAEFSAGSTSYWRKYLAYNSKYVFGLGQPNATATTGYTTDFNLVSDDDWDQNADGIIFSCCGTVNEIMTGGQNYRGETDFSTGALTATLAKLSDGYDLFESTENHQVDFLIMGSAAYDMETTQALANKLISIAELRKDSIAFISPYRGASISDTSVPSEVTVRSAADITENLISFYSPITSSSYAVFDSGYKYMYDRFSNTFRYVPLNGDIAGTCARNDINNFPWYSPAGTARGTILNAVKLAYNPTKSQRDRLYSNRINPVISSPGSGIILFGDKTGLSRASAFDRINVRRLFVYIENAISQAAKDVLFEFNDEVTRTNFVNTIEPFLRDIQAKRGIFDYIVICDETNNTGAVIDNNEFIADIYIKPSRSINFIGLNFIATKTGVDFEEVIGNF
jgi:hypothetical protein